MRSEIDPMMRHVIQFLSFLAIGLGGSILIASLFLFQRGNTADGPIVHFAEFNIDFNGEEEEGVKLAEFAFDPATDLPVSLALAAFLIVTGGGGLLATRRRKPPDTVSTAPQ